MNPGEKPIDTTLREGSWREDNSSISGFFRDALFHSSQLREAGTRRRARERQIIKPERSFAFGKRRSAGKADETIRIASREAGLIPRKRSQSGWFKNITVSSRRDTNATVKLPTRSLLSPKMSSILLIAATSRHAAANQKRYLR